MKVKTTFIAILLAGSILAFIFITMGWQPATAGQNLTSGATTYYVATAGNDSNPGTETAPWRTIQHVTGIGVGGYDSLRGSTHDCIFVNNTLFQNDTLQDGNGEMLIQYDVHDNVIKNNIFYANDQGLFFGNIFTNNRDNDVDYNLFYAPAGAVFSEWQWNNVTHQGFAAYQAATGNDANSLFAGPLFVSVTTPDLHLQSGSPAVDKGVNMTEAGVVDFDGNARLQNSAIDMGALEFVVFNEFVYLPVVHGAIPAPLILHPLSATISPG